MIRKITCIECPAGCILSVDVEDGRVILVEGNKCPKGEAYAIKEVEDPERVLASTVLAVGLSVKMIPVRTDKPVPKEKMFDVMREVHKIRVREPVAVGQLISRDICSTGANLIATREVTR